MRIAMNSGFLRWRFLFRFSSRVLCLVVFSLCSITAAAQTARRPKALKKESVDLLVTGGTVVTMNARFRVFDDGAVAIRGDKIVAVGPSNEVAARYTAARRILAGGKLVLPGLINTHGHAPMVLLRGIANDLTLQDWLEKYIFPAEARNVTEEFVIWGTRLAALEMIRGGTTTYVDMYYFEDAIARETKAAGMRGILGQTIIDFPVPDAKTPADAFARTEEFLKRWKGDPLIRPAVAPHSIYTESKETLQSAAHLARRHKAPLLIHVAETMRELDDSLAKHGMTPVAYLDSLGLLGPDMLAAHCVWVNDADIALLVKNQVGCAHNPSSNMLLASGVAPVPAMLKAGLRLGLGTDGAAGSNNDLELMEEMDLAAKLQKVSRMDPQALEARQSLAMATIGGARALHMESEIGSLEVGKKADLIVLSLNAPHAVPMYDLYAQIVYSLKSSDVQTVVIGGKVVMHDRQVLTLNESEILARAREYRIQVKHSLTAPTK